jgi:hypothetical protein
MDAEDIRDLIGDGNARVSLSLGMADKDFGSGYDVHVTVSLTCDQHRRVILLAYEAAGDIVSDMVLEARERAEALWEEAKEGN